MIKFSGKIKFLFFLSAAITAGVLLCGYRPIFDYFSESMQNRGSDSAGMPVGLSEIKSGRVIIALTLGQSNAGNYGQTLYYVKHDVYFWNNSMLYRYKEPVPGASGKGGSVWGMLGDLFIEKNFCDKAVFVSIAKGSTSVQSWSEGECSITLKKVLADLKKHNIKLTHVFWHQGEEDNLYKTPPLLYKLRLGKVIDIIRSYGQEAPVFVSVATFNPWAKNKLSIELRKAQLDFIKENHSVFAGPDTDTLISHTDRFDGIHFSGSGMKKYSQLWFKAVAEKQK
jgi:lysophospholipase L1-like esterase